ncbi:MAG: SCO1664 family protein [Acidimicrobiia bacterium]
MESDELAELLGRGELEVVGRMRYASNGTFLVQATADGVDVSAVYKPRRGERPLWDFPDGTLCHREVASYEVSRALGFGIVPVTVLRDDGPLGPGAVQRFVEHDPEEHYFTLLPANPERFREFAVFDVLANNTDRKGGHCLYDQVNEMIVGIDHGLTFHPMWKLRTVIWDFAGEPLTPDLTDALCRFARDLEQGEVGERLARLLSPEELAALSVRAADLLRDGCLPNPEPGYHSVPWPMV